MSRACMEVSRRILEDAGWKPNANGSRWTKDGYTDMDMPAALWTAWLELRAKAREECRG